MDGFDVGGCVEAEGDAALVGEDDYAQAGLIETGDGLGDAGEDLEAGPRGDVLAFRHFPVEDSVAVEEDGGEVARNGFRGRIGHGVMIATGVPEGAFPQGLEPTIMLIDLCTG